MSPPSSTRAFLGLTPAIWLLLANTALYAVCYQAQQPALPYILKHLSPDAKAAYASFKSTFWVIQLVGSLISGFLVDVFGVKSVLVLSFLSSAVSYAITGHAVTSASLATLYLGAVPTVFQHAMLGARAYVAAATPESGSERASVMGYVGVSYGVGMVIGPALGGWLSSQSLALASWAAAAGSVVSTVVITLFLARPASSSSSGSNTASDGSKKQEEGGKASWASVRTALSSPVLLSLLTVKTLSMAASSVFHTVFSLVGEERFGLGVEGMGYLLSWVGAAGTLASLLLVKPVSERFAGRDGPLSIACGLAMAALFAAFTQCSTAAHVFALALPMVAVSTVFSTANSAALTRAVPSSLTGSVVALDMALGSGTRVLAPPVCAWLVSSYGFAAVGAASGATMLLMVALLASGAMRVDAAQGQPEIAKQRRQEQHSKGE